MRFKLIGKLLRDSMLEAIFCVVYTKCVYVLCKSQ